MTDTPRLWDRRADETPKSYAAFLAYVNLGERRGVREAARQHHAKATSAGEISSVEDTTVRTWISWSSKHAWVSRATARSEWIQHTSDKQIIITKLACEHDGVRQAQKFLRSDDVEVWFRGAKGFRTLFPAVQQVEDVSERFDDLSDISDEGLERMREIRDAARAKPKE